MLARRSQASRTATGKASRLVSLLAFPALLATVLAVHLSHVQQGWLPHSRRAPWTPRVSVAASVRTPGGSSRLSVQLRVGAMTPRRTYSADEGDRGHDDEAAVPQPTKKRLTKREKNIIMNARRQKNLEAHLNGSYVPPPPVFEFRRSGRPGGLLGADPPGGPPIHLLDRVNLHLHQEQFDRDGYRGGIRPGRERGGLIISAALTYPIIGPDGTSADVKYSFNPADLSFMPQRQYNLSYGSCAVVGNSATLLRHEYGEEIDSHDMVLRINYAPLAGFERHVGRTTTFDMVNSKHAASLSAAVVDSFHQGRPMLDESRNRTSMVLFEAANWHRNYYTYSRLLQKLPQPQLLILSPDFANAAEVLWREMSAKWPELAQSCDRRVRSTELGLRPDAACHSLGVSCGYSMHRGSPTQSCKPNSGFVSTVFAAQICNRVTLYGFEGVSPSEAAANASSHYFDDEPANLAAHSYILTQNVLKHLASVYPIDIRGA